MFDKQIAGQYLVTVRDMSCSGTDADHLLEAETTADDIRLGLDEHYRSMGLDGLPSVVSVELLSYSVA